MDQPELTLEQKMKIFWDSISDHQKQFVIERIACKSDAEACRHIRMNYLTVMSWANKKMIDQYVAYQRGESLKAARFVLTESVIDAVNVLRRELKGKRKLTAAKEILDRAGLPAISRQEVGGNDGKELIVKVVRASDTSNANSDSDQ